MLANELADVVVELMLWLLSYVQFDDLGLVVKAVAEEGFEFLGL
jgi:Na+/serine symporter